MPATSGGTANNAVVLGRNNWVKSYLTHDLNTGAPVAVNISGPASLFADGYVARTVTNGVAHTYGEGNNWKQSPYLTGFDTQYTGNEMVWGAQMQKIINECTCK